MTCGKEGTSHLSGWTKSDGERGEREREKEREEKRGEEERSEKLQLLSRFARDQIVDSGLSKRQSWSTH